MTNESVLLIEDSSPFAPISTLHYEFYNDAAEVLKQLSGNDAVQCVVGRLALPFGKAQKPDIYNFADGVDTMAFLKNLSLK
jgi:hypothetical protein